MSDVSAGQGETAEQDWNAESLRDVRALEVAILDAANRYIDEATRGSYNPKWAQTALSEFVTATLASRESRKAGSLPLDVERLLVRVQEAERALRSIHDTLDDYLHLGIAPSREMWYAERDSIRAVLGGGDGQ